MAEVLGAVSSGFAVGEFALTVGESISKLRRLWKDVQEAPEQVDTLKTEVSLLEVIISTLHTGSQTTTPSATTPASTPALALAPATALAPTIGTGPVVVPEPTAHPAVIHFRKALKDLHTLVDDLSTEISSAKRSNRIVAKLKVVLRKGDIEKFQSRLDKALRLLQLALSVLQASQFGHQSTQLEFISNQLIQNALTHAHQTAIMEHQASTINNMLLLMSSQTPTQGHVIEETRDAESSSKGWTSRGRVCRRNLHLPNMKPSILGSVVLVTDNSDMSLSGYRARIQMPSWLSSKAWDFALEVSSFGWQTNLVTFNVVPFNSLVFQYAGSGNVHGMRRLFAQGLASPLDCDIAGGTLVFVGTMVLWVYGHQYANMITQRAAWRGQPDVVDELMKFDQIRLCSNWALTATYLLISMSSLSARRIHQTFGSGLLDFAVEELLLDEHVNTPGRMVMLINGAWFDPNLGSEIAKACSWYNLPPSLMQENILDGLSPVAGHSGLDVLRTMIRPHGPIDATDVQRWTADGASIFHVLFYFLGKYNTHPQTMHTDIVKAIKELIGEVIVAGDDLHRSVDLLGRKDLSPFSTLLRGIKHGLRYYWYGSEKSQLSVLRRALGRSLTILYDCGVDLQSFGGEDGLVQVHMDFTSNRHRHRPWTQCLRVKELHCAATPDDWRIIWDLKFSMEDLVGDFWRLIETPVQNIPGAWPEADSDRDSDCSWDSDLSDWD